MKNKRLKLRKVKTLSVFDSSTVGIYTPSEMKAINNCKKNIRIWEKRMEVLIERGWRKED